MDGVTRMKPKQVGEQHKTLFNPEYNYDHKVVQKKKQKIEKKRAEKEIEQFLKEGENDSTAV